MKDIKLIIGLGNPDKEYEKTYHNVGHLLINDLKEKSETKNQTFLKTETYMNQSGLFVKEALKKYKAKPINLLVVHDDSDIELGRYKLSFGRNSAGHKGVENIIKQLKTKDFWRLRIGIRPKNNKEKADKLVLKSLSPAARKNLQKVFEEAAALFTTS